MAAGAAAAGASVLLWSADAILIAAAVIAGAALGGARRHPRAAWLVATAALLATVPQGGLLTVPTYLLVPVHAFCAGRWDRRWSGITGMVALIVVPELAVLVAHESAVPMAFTPVAAWAAGRALREREQMAARLTERARELEEEREAYAELSVRYERAQIAAELHDIVAHAISIMVVQASAGQRLAAVDPELTGEAFDAIAAAAHEAEQDIGRLVELLSDAGAAGPAPDVALVEELVARAAGSGLMVTLRLEGERENLPPAAGQAAFRVVQEGLTNALRHASGAAVEVLVSGGRDALIVEVTNGPAAGEGPLRGVGTGTGLTGLRERVAAAGGLLEAGRTPDGGWRLSATMPLRTRTGLT